MADRRHRAMVRDTRLRELGFADYNAYLRSTAWRDVRERYRASDLPQICMCGSEEFQLHHTTYERVGREELEDLIPLCEACHTQAHILEAEGIIELDLKGFYYDPERAAANAVTERSRKARAHAEAMLDEHKVHDAYDHGVRTYDQRKPDRRPWAKKAATRSMGEGRDDG